MGSMRPSWREIKLASCSLVRLLQLPVRLLSSRKIFRKAGDLVQLK
jgi:hypothetical protein